MITRDNLFSPVQKIVFLIFSSLLSITFDNQKILIGYFVICFIIFLFAKISVAQFRIWLFSVLLTFWGTLLSQSMFYHQVPRTVIFQIISESTPLIGPLTNGINIYREGLEYGIIQGMRFAITLTCGLFICFSTESKDLLKAAMRLKIPANIGFMLSIALRFIPMIVNESKTVIRAQKLRGFSVIQSGIFHPLKTAHFLLRPILVNAVRRSSMLSLSVESRHFNYSLHTFAISSKYGSKVITIVLCTAITLLLLCIFIKIVNFLYISNYFYASWLRPLYYAGERFL